MKLFRRRPSLPSALKPPLAADERVVAWATLDEERVVVATNHGLWLPPSPGSTTSTAYPSLLSSSAPATVSPVSETEQFRLGWHQIHKAAWSGRELRITPAEVVEERDGYTVLADGPILTFLLLDPGELPDQVRTRVTKSVAYTTHHALTSGGVRVVGRRITGQNGLSWAVRYDTGTAATSGPVLELTEQLVATARETMTAPD